MSSDIRAYRIFIASPGGLEQFRQRFRRVADTYNEADAFSRGLLFWPVGWEYTLPGMGRAQHLINDDLRRCDYFVLLLKDRWGSPPGDGAAGYTSGTEEEFETARALFDDPNAAMRQLVVFFLPVETEKLSDPGPQLAQVLAFRERLETERTMMFAQVEDEEALGDAMRRLMAQWVRDHEDGATDAARAITPSAPPLPTASGGRAIPVESGVDHAQALIGAERFTAAETLLAVKTSADDDPRAAVSYASLLERVGRRKEAMTAYADADQLAGRLGDKAIRAEALVGLGRLEESFDMRREAELHLTEGVALLEAAGGRTEAARARIRLGDIMERNRDPNAAEAQYRAAIDLAAAADDDAVQGDGWLGLASMHRESFAYVLAADDFARAIELKRAAGTELGDALAGLGAIQEQLGELEAAVASHRASLVAFEAEGNDRGVADSLDHLGNVLAATGETGEALEAFRRSASAWELVAEPEAAANAHRSVGHLLVSQGEQAEAEKSLRTALGLVSQADGESARLLRTDVVEALNALLERAGAST